MPIPKSKIMNEFAKELKFRQRYYPLWLAEDRFDWLTKDLADKRIRLWIRAIGILDDPNKEIIGPQYIIQEVERELRYRKKLYGIKVQSGSMHPELMKKKLAYIEAGLYLIKKSAGLIIDDPPDILEQGSLF